MTAHTVPVIPGVAKPPASTSRGGPSSCRLTGRDLQRALSWGELAVFYQPIMSLGHGRPVGAEALLRWNHPDIGLIKPDEFLPTATSAGLAGDITSFVLSQACQQLAAWQAQGNLGQRFRVAVNLTSDDLANPDFPASIAAALERDCLDAGCLVVEVTERDLIADTTIARQVLRTIRQLGVRIALDDFGTGYSSLSYLREFPVDIVKIDRSFIAGLGRDASATALVRALMSFTATLGLSVVAEGVENDIQLEVLRQLGCELGQGYLWSPAVCADRFGEIIAAAASTSSSSESLAGYPAPQVTPHLSWAAIDSLPTEIAIIDAAGEIVATNLSWQRFALEHGGTASTSGVGVNYLAVCDSARRQGCEDAGTVAEGLRMILSEDRESFAYEYDFPVGDGTLHFAVQASALAASGGAVVAHLDITDRHRAVTALAASESRFHDIFEQLPVGILHVGSEDRIVDVNLALCEIVGLSREELHARLRRSIFDDDAGDAGSVVTPLLSEGSQSVLHRVRRPDGSVRLARVRELAIPDGDGDSPRLLTAVIDVTEQIHLNEELRRAQEMEALGRLAGGIAHEINTPTQFIADNLAFMADMWDGLDGLIDTARRAVVQLRQGSDPAGVAGLLETALSRGDLEYAQAEIPGALTQSQEGTRRVSNIVKAMKAFGHPDQDRPEATDLNQMILDAITVATSELKHVAAVSTELGDLPIVSCYRGAMSQVILNLLVNASDAISESQRSEGGQGKIRVRTAVEGSFACIEVTDDGSGIPPDILPKIFEPFFTTKPVGKGTGQGLALAWVTVVDRHKGRLDVSTSPSGTTFTVSIPIVDDSQTAEDMSEATVHLAIRSDD